MQNSGWMIVIIDIQDTILRQQYSPIVSRVTSDPCGRHLVTHDGGGSVMQVEFLLQGTHSWQKSKAHLALVSFVFIEFNVGGLMPKGIIGGESLFESACSSLFSSTESIAGGLMPKGIRGTESLFENSAWWSKSGMFVVLPVFSASTSLNRIWGGRAMLWWEEV